MAGVDPDGALAEAADVRRALTLTPTLDGQVYLRGHLDPVGGEYLHTALAALINGDRPAGDRRCHAERQADALVALARGALDAGGLPDVRGERPHVRVTIDWQALCAARGTPGVAGGDLGWAGPITAETARRLACDAQVARIITGPDGLPLDVGRAQRTAPPPSGAPSRPATDTACSPAATPSANGATSTISCTGPSAGPPAATTAPCSANATTPPATKAASPATAPPAAGTPTDPTAPRSTAEATRTHPPAADAHVTAPVAMARILRRAGLSARYAPGCPARQPSGGPRPVVAERRRRPTRPRGRAG